MVSRSVAISRLEVDAGQAGELAELHVEDVLGLHVGELERLGREPDAGGGAVLASRG